MWTELWDRSVNLYITVQLSVIKWILCQTSIFQSSLFQIYTVIKSFNQVTHPIVLIVHKCHWEHQGLSDPGVSYLDSVGHLKKCFCVQRSEFHRKCHWKCHACRQRMNDVCFEHIYTHMYLLLFLLLYIDAELLHATSLPITEVADFRRKHYRMHIDQKRHI